MNVFSLVRKVREGDWLKWPLQSNFVNSEIQNVYKARVGRGNGEFEDGKEVGCNRVRQAKQRVENAVLWLRMLVWILMACRYTQSFGKSLAGFKQSVKMARLEIWKYKLAAFWGADCRRIRNHGKPLEDCFQLADEAAWTEVDGEGEGLGLEQQGDKMKAKENT